MPDLGAIGKSASTNGTGGVLTATPEVLGISRVWLGDDLFLRQSSIEDALSYRILFGWPIYSDTATLSGGSWDAARPLSWVKNRQPSERARSTNLLAASTQIDADLGTSRSLQVMALVGHNLSPTATIRFRVSTIAGQYSGAALVYDSGFFVPYPPGETAESLEGLNWPALQATIPKVGRYVRTEVVDATNPDGYLEIGRLVLAGGIQPTINMNNGAGLGLETATTFTDTDGGASYYTKKIVRRALTFTISDLPEAEALRGPFNMKRIAGTSGQLLIVYDPTDVALGHWRNFLGVMRELSALEFAYSRGSTGFGVREQL